MDNAEQILARLTSMESETKGMRSDIKDFGKALVQMAKTEERVSVLLDNNSLLFKKIDALELRTREVESINATQAQSLGFFERFGWLAATAIAGVIGWMFKG